MKNLILPAVLLLAVVISIIISNTVHADCYVGDSYVWISCLK